MPTPVEKFFDNIEEYKCDFSKDNLCSSTFHHKASTVLLVLRGLQFPKESNSVPQICQPGLF
ncbi:hypothetical protein ACTXT7_000734 [Hymenolepis weldensis]